MSSFPAASRPSTPDAAERLAAELADVLAREHGILADVHVILAGEAAVSIYPGLLARTDGQTIRWQVPTFGERGKPLWTFASTPATAARRLAEKCKELQERPLAEIVRGRLVLDEVLAVGDATSA